MQATAVLSDHFCLLAGLSFCVSFRQSSLKCVRNVSVMGCRDLAPSRPAGCGCPLSEPWGISSRIALMEPHVSSMATKEATEPPVWRCTTWSLKTLPTSLLPPMTWSTLRNHPTSAPTVARLAQQAQLVAPATAPPQPWMAVSCCAVGGGTGPEPNKSQSAATARSTGVATSAA